VLNASEWEAWAHRLGLSAEARRVVAAIRSAPPSRLVRSGAGNVPCRYPSTKMGQTIQAESHTVELALVHAMEQDRTMLEYWDQPGTIRLACPSNTGRRVVTAHTPDYFEVRIDAAGWVECKPEQRLHHLAREAPHRYRRDATGRWTCPPGEEYAVGYGLTYRVFSSAEINWIEQYALAEPEYAPVFRDEEMAQAYAIVSKTPSPRAIGSPLGKCLGDRPFQRETTPLCSRQHKRIWLHPPANIGKTVLVVRPVRGKELRPHGGEEGIGSAEEPGRALGLCPSPDTCQPDQAFDHAPPIPQSREALCGCATRAANIMARHMCNLLAYYRVMLLFGGTGGHIWVN
jgi:hypothetical protein